ncbi:peptidylprolyl isomerase [Kerstersia gyiorum]|jgi:peptidyl-prolyl cis-trans isomerase SurA|uniref:Chaperone SurA n=1 Tax=Kerstersia gyiorum TaxID=206506 RepID=A0A4Q7MNF1_9BURK|nr:peptidylprolyl isomerase [Kerstersia gyiorum]MCO7636551.1 peptidylprolyl isomerase [Pseudomonas sp. S 311-6]KAB0543682.1 molecular chaperone SurA [Kerstersia gyiorum]MCH4272922.1 peptidylprolyl isomerase [Kerstersia gyiorum]MCI1229341.1 peptidylprolyl isomerase [Kerstersia gyiorum]MCP1637012.1 peptidyl-prolyl cis-trans isomerase SurA [Kerstersia gyiorum]
MLNVRLKQLPLLAALALASLGAAQAQSTQAVVEQPKSSSEAVVDGIAAIVNNDVITLRELNQRTLQAQGELSAQGVALPDAAVLQRQVLERMISERLEDQEAQRLNLSVSNAELNSAVGTIAQRNGFTEEQMRQQVTASGLTWQGYLEVLRRDILMDRLRQRVVDSSIMIPDSEVDAFIRDERTKSQSGNGFAAANSGPVALAQILIRVPENSSREEEAAARARAEAVLARVRGGEDFAAVAAAESQGAEALQGGLMGERPMSSWPDLFVRAVASVPQGQVSELVRSGLGYHILKVVSRSDSAAAQQRSASDHGVDFNSQAPMPVTQTKARHILIRTSAVMSDERAKQQLDQLRLRILQGGESFEDLARRYSKDSSAPQGGDLGWLSPGETVPQFEQAMDALSEGSVSQPIKSPFGWHLIKVDSRRTQDMAEAYQRMQARQILFERRALPAFEEWLEQLRERAYIDNRLERRQRLEQE